MKIKYLAPVIGATMILGGGLLLAALFAADRSLLSGSLGGERGRVRLADGHRQRRLHLRPGGQDGRAQRRLRCRRGCHGRSSICRIAGRC